MDTLQIVMVSIFTFIAIIFLTKMVIDFSWQKRLNQYKESQHLEIEHLPKQLIIKNAYIFSLSIFIAFAFLVSGRPIFSDEIVVNNKTYVDAKSVLSYEYLKAKLNDYQTDNYYWGFPEVGAALDDLEASDAPTTRSYTETNVQVEGVDEADVIKTDGYHIYYAPAYGNTLYVYEIDDEGIITLSDQIDLGNYYVEGLFLTDQKLVVIGYEYDTNPFYVDVLYCGWFYVNDTATIQIYNISDMTLDYELTTDSHFYQYRLIDNMLYLFSQKYIYQDQEEFRPYYEINKVGLNETYYLPYESIYFFDDYQTNSMTVITSLNMDTYELNAQAFMMSISLLYANQDNFYVSSYYGFYDDKDNTWINQTRVFKFSLDEEKTLNYVATATLKGFINNQYWMDEYQGYFRVVTTDWTIKNRLYVFEEDLVYDKLNVVSLTDDGIGLENETVKSVRFNQELVQVVTFEQHDPLYTIDLSNPSLPIINSNPIIEDGFSVYLHVWHEDHLLVGFGFETDSNGFTTNLKLSAYNTITSQVLDSYSFTNSTIGETWSYSEAIYNPRALLINVDKGLFAFPVSAYTYTNNDYYYNTYYYVFEIDFNRALVIGEPIIISHDLSENYNYIDRGIEIENKIYTFSRYQIKVFDLETRNYTQTINN